MAILGTDCGVDFHDTTPAGLRARFDKEAFKQIFRDGWNEFKTANPRYDNEYVDSVVQKMLGCGDPTQMGYAQYTCLNCGETRTVGFTCKSCFCLSCGKVRADTWAEFVGRRLLPGVTYRHISLTMPDCLRVWFYRNPALLSNLMRCGNACLKEVFSASVGDKAKLDIGTIVVLHTAGRPGTYNPHLHVIVTAGGIGHDGRWADVDFIPYKLLHRKWQYHLLSMLRREVNDPQIESVIDDCWKKYPKGFVAHVKEKKVPPEGKGLARYLAKYLVSPPISVRRIESYDGSTVRYWYRDHRSGRIEHETLPVQRFIGRMVQHILPRGFQRIRYYGLHGSRRYEGARNQVTELVAPDSVPNPAGHRALPRKTFSQLCKHSHGVDPFVCSACGERLEITKMVVPRRGVIYDLFEEMKRKPRRACDFHPANDSSHASGRLPETPAQLPLPAT